MALSKEDWMKEIEKNLFNDRDFQFIRSLGIIKIPKPDTLSKGVFDLIKKNDRIRLALNRRYRWANQSKTFHVK